MIRTINYTVVKATGVKVTEGVAQTFDLGTMSYTGRRKSKKAIENHFASEMEEYGADVLVYEEKEIEKKFELSLEDFLAVATEIE